MIASRLFWALIAVVAAALAVLFAWVAAAWVVGRVRESEQGRRLDRVIVHHPATGPVVDLMAFRGLAAHARAHDHRCGL